MKNRFLCMLLALAVVLSTVVMATPVYAKSNMVTSDALVNLLKEFEGFAGACVKDGPQRSVGYGTRCDVCDPNAPGYPNNPCTAYTSTNPISEDHATYLMRKFLSYFENKVNSFADKYGLNLTQQQFDALISFTYNVGEGWTLPSYDPEGNFRSAIAEGKTGDELVYAFGLWSKSNGGVSQGHIKRRMIEAQIYLYGEYKNDWPELLRYILLDANGGTTRYAYQTFHAGQQCPVRWEFTEVPKDKDGKELIFDGWYTQRQGGVKVETLNGAFTNGMVLYAHWKNDKGDTVDLGVEQSTPVNVDVVVTSWWPNQLYEGPATYYGVVRKVLNNEQLRITKTVTGKDGQLWGYCSDGWIPLQYTTYNDAINSAHPNGVWYKITSEVTSSLSIRNKPGTSGAVVGYKYAGNEILIVQTQDEEGTSRTWGQMTDGNWICIKEGSSKYAAVMNPQPSTKPSTTSGAQVLSIKIATMPKIRNYVLNSQDVLPNLDGAQLLINYTNGKTQTVPIVQHMVSGFDNTKLGTNTITVFCGGKITTFTVEIVPTSITSVTLGSKPNKLEYIRGEEKLDLTGATLKVVYDGTEEHTITVTPDMVAGFDNSKVGTNTLTVYFKGFTVKFDVTITKPIITFLNYDGTVISKDRYDIGEKVTPPANPTRPADSKGEYEFAGWDREVGPCTGSTTYKATYKLRYATGDVDRNHLVDEEDAIYLLWHVFFPEEYPVYAGTDYDKDGSQNENDAIYLLWHVFFPEEYPLK